MKKSGKLLLIAAGVVLVASRLSMMYLDRYERNPNLAQYLNRLLEFVDLKKLESARQTFLGLVDYGLDPAEAFWVVVDKEAYK